MHYVYILRDKSSRVYVGYSNDLKKRLGYHQRGEVETTKEYDQARLVWYCGFNDKGSALKFERYLKEGSGHAFAKKHLIGN